MPPQDSGVLEDRNARPQWGIDSMLIDEELLYLEDEEADRVYSELKARSLRRREMEARQNRLSTQMRRDEEEEQVDISEGDMDEPDFVKLSG